MSDIHLVLSPSERELLVQILGARRKEKRVEVHRAEFSREFRHGLEEEEALIDGLLGKLTQAGEPR